MENYLFLVIHVCAKHIKTSIHIQTYVAFSYFSWNLFLVCGVLPLCGIVLDIFVPFFREFLSFICGPNGEPKSECCAYFFYAMCFVNQYRDQKDKTTAIVFNSSSFSFYLSTDYSWCSPWRKQSTKSSFNFNTLSRYKEFPNDFSKNCKSSCPYTYKTIEKYLQSWKNL